MRTHLFKKDRSMYPRDWHFENSKSQNNGATWGDHTPYSNVLWIKYLLGYLKKAFKECGSDTKELARFNEETKELSKLLNPRTLVTNGAFSTAGEIYEFVCDQGWLSHEQIAALTEGSSMLRDSNEAGRGEGVVGEAGS
jgi:serine/threonine-protein kinase haspin